MQNLLSINAKVLCLLKWIQQIITFSDVTSNFINLDNVFFYKRFLLLDELILSVLTTIKKNFFCISRLGKFRQYVGLL